MSRSGSNESNKGKNNNFRFVSKNSINNYYKNYLREKRTKSLEKSLSRSLSKSSQAYASQEYYKITENNKNNIRLIEDQKNNSINERMNSINSKTLNNEDIPIKLPERLDRNLVKRKLPKRVDNRQLQNKNTYHFCYENHLGKCSHSFMSHNCGYYIKNYYNEKRKNKINVETKEYNHNEDDIIISNNLDLNIYEKEYGKKKINNGRY